MTEISPAYYAESVEATQFIVRGKGFNLIPDNAVGVGSQGNDEPLDHQYTEFGSWIYDIESKTPTEMVLKQRAVAQHASPSYLGAILSQDREVVFYQNDSKPLP